MGRRTIATLQATTMPVSISVQANALLDGRPAWTWLSLCIDLTTPTRPERLSDMETTATLDPTAPPLKVGDIMVSSWGYDQTNIDFYQVVRTTAKSAWLRGIASHSLGEDGFMTGHVVAVPDHFIEEKAHAHRIRTDGGFHTVTLRLSSFQWAFPWNGQPERESWYA